jgi:aldehyde dehydrogenase (NAD(P)+)
MNPVNDYLGPIFEKIFAPLVKRGYLAIAYGGPEVGAYLCYNERVDEVHITGSDKTHDLIVWGPPGPERENRKRSNRPLLTKRITSELGNISPILVAPGDYTEDELWFTARNIAGMVTHNASYNCNAGKLLVLPKGWRGRNELLRLLGRVFESTPTRRAYYPGSFDRFRRLTEGRERVTKYGQADESRLPWTIVHVPDPNADDPSFSIEPFCSVLSEVEVGSPEPGEFLQEATRFVNERVWGTLNVALIVHPRLEKDHAAELERAIRELRYGSVCLNYWPAGVYGFAVPPWGAYPGSTLSDIKSGIGFVHNTSMWEHVEKVVLKSPLVAFPKHVWFPDYRTLLDVAKKIVAFEQNPSLTKLPALIYSAVRA